MPVLFSPKVVMFVVRSGSAFEVLAPAKLNLFLEVLARREDGFHELETLMTAIDLYDTITLYPADDGRLSLVCRWACGIGARSGGRPEQLPQGGENIAFRAAELLRERAGVTAGAKIHLIKRIPAEAGLGGASSDAAAVLVAANELWGLGWSAARLMVLAAELGSDVPFFLNAGGLGTGTAICRGRGERIEPIAGTARQQFVAIRPPVGLKTPEVFRKCVPAVDPRGVNRALAAAQNGNAASLGAALSNGLETAAAELSPWIDRLQGKLQQAGGCGCRMSGSGSSCFGLFRGRRQGRRAARRLRAQGLGTVHAAASAPAPGRRRAAGRQA